MIDIDFDIRTAQGAFDPDSDFMPMLVITGTDGRVTMCALAVDDPAGYLAPVLSKFILDEGPIAALSFTSDVFSASDESVPRPLDKAFAAGDPRVTEALSVTRCARGGVVEAAVIPYLRTSDGVVWGEVRRLDEPGGRLSGRVIDALRAALGEYKDIPLFNQGENQ